MSGWLILTQWGLAPHKKHQASLGALTGEITCFARYTELLKKDEFPIYNKAKSMSLRAKSGLLNCYETTPLNCKNKHQMNN